MYIIFLISLQLVPLIRIVFIFLLLSSLSASPRTGDINMVPDYLSKPFRMQYNHIIDPSGTLVVTTVYWLKQNDEIGPKALTIIFILGAQASGKSTILKILFGTKLPVPARYAVDISTEK